MTNCCRICLDKENTILSLETVVESNGTKLTCMQMYENITKLEESANNPVQIPRHICISCLGELNRCYKFQQKAIESFNVLIRQHSLHQDRQFEQISEINACTDGQLKSEPVEPKDLTNPVRLIQSAVLSPHHTDEEYLEVDFLDEKSYHDQSTQKCADSDQLVQENVVIVESNHKCTDCPKAFESQATLDTHLVLEHFQETPDGDFICPVCSKMFNSRRCLRQHSRTHQDRDARKHRCRYCEKAFNFGHHLKIHERMHTKQKPFSCSTCGKTFASKDRLANHHLQHVDEPRYACELCSACFRSKKVLKMHSILKHDAPVGKFEAIKCNKCDKVLYSKSATNAHMRGPCGTDLAADVVDASVSVLLST